MKTKKQARGKCRRVLKSIALASGVWLSAGLFADAQDEASTTPAKKPAVDSAYPEPGEFNNWLELSAGSFFVDGNKAAFQQRHSAPAGPFGGVEDFHWEQAVAKKGLFSVDGRGIFDESDYLLKLQLSHPDKGYVQVGYRSFRTYYDGSGGFFPQGTNNWFDIYSDRLHVDRGEVWFEAGLRLPEVPEVTFRYSHEFRDGRKDSTIWGDTILTGVPGPNNARGVVPTFWKIDEQRDTFTLDAKHTIAKTGLGAGVRYELIDNNNSLNIHRRPGELTGTPTQAADRFVTQRNEFDSDMLNAHAFTETRFSDEVLFTTGFSFTTLDTDVGGSRIYGADYDPVYDPVFARRQNRDEGFLDLSGGSQVKQYVMNVNLMLTPIESLVIVPSLRVEHQDQDGDAAFTMTSFNSTRTATSEDVFNTRTRGFTDVSEALELRYSGITNWVFYTRGEWLEGQGDLKERQIDIDPDDPDVTTTLIQRSTDSDRFTQKYVAGINWYPARRVNLSGQYYYKVRANDYTHLVDLTTNTPPSGNRYPAFITNQDFKTHDVNFRFTIRPLNNLTLVSRYDYQISTVNTRGDFLADVQSAKMTTHIFSESISWAPFARCYFQGSINYALDRMATPVNSLFGGATNSLVPASRNNYWNASALVGYALSERMDMTAQYTYYRADNYRNNSDFSQPYGASAEEHGITVSLARQITRSLRWTLKYGFFTNRDETAGGHNDFDAHMLFSSVQYRF